MKASLRAERFFARFLVIGPEDEECWGADMIVVDEALLNQVSSGG